jgi:polyisoprenoid-binding protein YceI
MEPDPQGQRSPPVPLPKLSRLKLALAAAVLLVAVLVGGPFVYIHFIEGDPPARPTLEATTGKARGDSAGSATDPTGTWKATTAGSELQYRVKEVLLGQDTTAVGRTSQVSGSLTIEGTSISSTKVVVDMTTVSSDKSLRDSQFRGRIMDVATFPTATFELTEPIALGAIPDDGVTITARAAGKLTLHGATKAVTFDLSALRTGGTVKVQGSIPVHFADYGIPNPSAGPAKVGDDGELAFVVAFAKP